MKIPDRLNSGFIGGLAAILVLFVIIIILAAFIQANEVQTKAQVDGSGKIDMLSETSMGIERAMGQGKDLRYISTWTTGDEKNTQSVTYEAGNLSPFASNQFSFASSGYGHTQRIRAFNTSGPFIGTGTAYDTGENFDSLVWLQGRGDLQGLVMDLTGKHPLATTDDRMSGNITYQSHVNVSKSKEESGDWIACPMPLETSALVRPNMSFDPSKAKS